MKKVVLVLAMGAFLFSCGKSACDCKTEAEELAKEAMSAMGDEAKTKELAEKSKELEEACKDYKEEDFKECK